MSISDGKVYYWYNVLTPVLDVDGETQSILCVSRDITLQYLTEQKLKQGSERDELTGLNNRRAFKEKIRKLYSSARDKKQKLAVMLMDLDHFKTINDTLGYAAGDHLLRILSKRLKQILEGRAFLARLGGDEFGVIIPNVQDIGELNQIAQQILQQLEIPITFSGNYINGGMSIGCGLYPDDANDLSELLKCADTALNDVKAQGRGGMRMFDQDMFNAFQFQSLQQRYPLIKSGQVWLTLRQWHKSIYHHLNAAQKSNQL
jgi:diguanylate cyclase (GGDEF)-like protein